jgi:hypothetical protein
MSLAPFLGLAAFAFQGLPLAFPDDVNELVLGHQPYRLARQFETGSARRPECFSVERMCNTPVQFKWFCIAVSLDKLEWCPVVAHKIAARPQRITSSVLLRQRYKPKCGQQSTTG